MPIQTRSELFGSIRTLLADNTTGEIDPHDIRTVLNNIIDSGFLKENEPRPNVLPNGSRRILKGVQEINHVNANEFSSILTASYQPVSYQSRLKVRVAAKVSGDDSSLYSIVGLRRKVGNGEYRALDYSDIANKITFLGSKMSWRTILIYELQDYYNIGLNNDPVVFDYEFSPWNPQNLVDGQPQVETINLCAALGDIDVTVDYPKWRFAWKNATDFTEADFLSTDAIENDGTDWDTRLPDYPAGLLAEDAYGAFWFPGDLPPSSHFLYFDFYQDMNDNPIATNLEINGVAGKYYRGANAGWNYLQPGLNWGPSFDESTVWNLSTVSVEKKTGKIYVNRANDEIASGFGAEPQTTILELFELTPEGNFIEHSLNVPDAA